MKQTVWLVFALTLAASAGCRSVQSDTLDLLAGMDLSTPGDVDVSGPIDVDQSSGSDLDVSGASDVDQSSGSDPDMSDPSDIDQSSGGDLDVFGPGDVDVPAAQKSWNERFLTAVAQHDVTELNLLAGTYRWPECDEFGCVILSSVPFEGAVAIRGSFNGWAEGTMMEPVAELPGYHYYVLAYGGFERVAQYRLYYGEEWHDDLDNPLIWFSDVSINNAVYEPGSSRIARIKSVYSASLDNYRDVYLYLPAAMFQDPSADFPVMYMQDGFNVFKNPMAPFGSWEVDVSLDDLIQQGLVPALIVVGIDTQDRLNEYLYCELSANIGGEGIQVTPKLDAYLSFVVQDLKPLVDSLYPTRAAREWTGIGGSSLGGISSMYMAWKRPDVFGRVASFSGSYWIGLDEDSAKGDGGVSFLTILQQNPPGPAHSGLKIYLDSGDMGATTYPYESDARVYTDWVRNVLITYGWANRPEWDTDADVFSAPADLEVSTSVGQVPTLYWSATLPIGYATWSDYLRPDLDLLHLVGGNHQHNEAAWKARFPLAMRFLWGG